MPILMFLLLLLLRVIIFVIATIAISMILAFCFGLLRDGPRDFVSEQVFFRWTGTIVYFILYVAVGVIVDYLTGSLDAFAVVPVPLRWIGCTGLILAFTIVALVTGKPAQKTQQHPDWGTFSTAPHEPFILAPLIMAEFLKTKL